MSYPGLAKDLIEAREKEHQEYHIDENVLQGGKIMRETKSQGEEGYLYRHFNDHCVWCEVERCKQCRGRGMSENGALVCVKCDGRGRII